ncbi:MAG TPA: hypothetical protein VFE51_02870 [Verrucomicrobiae bacterium]|nr:hypothetical protein [Verrucomicrobiae bacterium]
MTNSIGIAYENRDDAKEVLRRVSRMKFEYYLTVQDAVVGILQA